MGLVIIVFLAGFTLWTTMRNVSTGVAHPILQVIGAQEFERAENPAIFWGIIAFNWLVAAAIAALILIWF
jgi:hypothetical protein